jgi:protein-L-isoaspartate O-methyltransferase
MAVRREMIERNAGRIERNDRVDAEEPRGETGTVNGAGAVGEVKVDRTALEEFGRGEGRTSRTVFEAWTRTTGRVRVVDYRNERRLIVAGDILSIYPLDEDWGKLRKEYWWHALHAVGVPPRPRALLVGLGGGTQVHMLQQLAQPREIAVIERDPVIVRVACDWFGLRRVGGLEFLCGDADRIVRWLTRVGRQFDFVMEDAAYAAPPEIGLPLAEALVALVAPGGRLVINRHLRGDGRSVAAALRPHFHEIRVRRVRRDGENVLICCVNPTD